MIDKNVFCRVVENIQLQLLKDKEAGEFFYPINQSKSETNISYNNQLSIKSVILLLEQWFPKDSDGHSEIEYYFGVVELNLKETEYSTPEQLYDYLIKSK